MTTSVRHPPLVRQATACRRSIEFEAASPPFKAVELAQRLKMMLDVSTIDLTASEEELGPFHETTLYFRNALADARNAWDRLRAEFGRAILEEALDEPPSTVLNLGKSQDGKPFALLIVIGGQTYATHRLPDTVEAICSWRLWRLPPVEDGFLHACRLADGSTQCDCAEWIYKIAGSSHDLCKHLMALDALGWL